MALVELIIPPDQASYSVTDGKEVVATQLDGGAARYRRDILGATSRVAVQWTIGPDSYRYLRSFYRAVTVGGSNPFNIGLLLDEPEITWHTANSKVSALKVGYVDAIIVLRAVADQAGNAY